MTDKKKSALVLQPSSDGYTALQLSGAGHLDGSEAGPSTSTDTREQEDDADHAESMSKKRSPPTYARPSSSLVRRRRTMPQSTGRDVVSGTAAEP